MPDAMMPRVPAPSTALKGLDSNRALTASMRSRSLGWSSLAWAGMVTFWRTSCTNAGPLFCALTSPVSTSALQWQDRVVGRSITGRLTSSESSNAALVISSASWGDDGSMAGMFAIIA